MAKQTLYCVEDESRSRQRDFLRRRDAGLSAETRKWISSNGRKIIDPKLVDRPEMTEDWIVFINRVAEWKP